MELWDLYTENREKTGKTMVRGEKQPNGYYRLIVHICIFNDECKMLIQQRQPFKDGWSGMWDLTVGGSVVAGENTQLAAERELYEEIGYSHSFKGISPNITLTSGKVIGDTYLLNSNVDISSLKLQYEEVKAVKWATLDEILKMIDDGEFIPYHKSFVELLFYLKDNRVIRTSKDKTANN